jgi:hypothetical protein
LLPTLGLSTWTYVDHKVTISDNINVSSPFVTSSLKLNNS